MHIRGRKVILREKLLSDIPEDYAWRVDEELAELDATAPIQMSYGEFSRYSREELFYSNTKSKRLGIDTLGGQHIGNCMYYDLDDKLGQAEMGIMIGDREYWGKGYGSDVVQALLNHLFSTVRLRRVYLHTLNWNHRAQSSFSKAGFRQQDMVSRAGSDFVRMEVLREEWENKLNYGDNRGTRN